MLQFDRSRLGKKRKPVYIRITENRRLATAAAAIKHRIVIRNTPRVFLPVLPLKKGSDAVAVVIVAVDEEKKVVGSWISVNFWSLTRRPAGVRAKLFLPQAVQISMDFVPLKVLRILEFEWFIFCERLKYL